MVRLPKKLFFVAFCLVALLAVGCESNDGPAEKAGEKLDQSAEKVKEELSTAGEKNQGCRR